MEFSSKKYVQATCGMQSQPIFVVAELITQVRCYRPGSLKFTVHGKGGETSLATEFIDLSTFIAICLKFTYIWVLVNESESNMKTKETRYTSNAAV